MLSLEQQSWVVAITMVYSTKSKMYIMIWPFTEEIWWPKIKKKKMSCDAERCKIRELHKMIFKNIKFSFYSDLSFREIALPSISIHMKIGINAFIVSFLPLFDGEWLKIAQNDIWNDTHTYICTHMLTYV